MATLTIVPFHDGTGKIDNTKIMFQVGDERAIVVRPDADCPDWRVCPVPADATGKVVLVAIHFTNEFAVDEWLSEWADFAVSMDACW